MNEELRETTVWTTPTSDRLHESRNCAGDMVTRIDCSLEEAVEANRWPCGNCVSDEVKQAAKELHREL